MLRKLNFIKLISLLVVVPFKYSYSEDVFFVVNKYEGSEFYCITNNSRALSWIIEDTTTYSVDLQQGSRFLPIAETLWKVDCNEIRKYGWQCRQSVADKIITDRRWENIQIHKTDYADDFFKKELQFSKILDIANASFNVPLSIRTSQEAHIFLCDGETVRSNCYWFILQGFHGKKTVLRKCPNDTIPTKHKVNVESPCNVTRVSNEHTSESSKFLTDTKWQHFMLARNNNKISLSKQDGQEIISYTDNEETYNIKNILIHSKRTVGLWKIHKDKYFKINQTSRTNFERTLYSVNGKICITTFVRMCKTCKIKFVITNEDNDKQVIGEETYEKMSKWTKVTFVKRATEAKKVRFAIITTHEMTLDSYWDIQEIFQCGENDLRMIHLSTMANCQLLSQYSNTIISLDNEVASSYSDKYAECAENTISTHCIPCNLFLNGNCGQLKICEKNQNELLCSCSAGYKTDNQKKHCGIGCDPKTYGHYCKKSCNANCLNCNHVDGTCTSCSNGYIGSKCEMAPIPVFKNGPKIETFGYTEAKIIVNDFELEGTSDNADSRYEYTIQYKEANFTQWTLHTDSAFAGMPHTFKIENLKPGVEYYVRSIIQKYVANYSDSIPKTEFLTKCDVIKSEDLEVGAADTIAFIKVKNNKKFKICKWKSSETKIDIQPNIQNFFYYLGDMTLSISGLKPLENFTLTIQNKNILVKIPFRTTEREPENEVVEQLFGLEEEVEQNMWQSDTIRDQEIPKASLKKTNSRSVEFEFSSVPRSELGGPLQIVTTAICLTDWCKDNKITNSFIYLQHKRFTFNSLAPFTNYRLTLGFHRKASSKMITFGSFKTKTEAPYSVKNLSVYSKNTHSISVRWRPPSPPTGILKLYQIKLLEQNRNINVTNSPCFLWPEYQCYTLENLVENRNYSVQLSAKNEEPDRFGQTAIINKAITTIEPSEEPPDVMLKWTLENDLDIRWKHPVVANGDIQSFKISVVPHSSSNNKGIDTSLDITKDQYKATYQKIVKLQNIRSSTKYKIMVKAFNGKEGKAGFVIDVSPPEIPVLETEPKIVNVSNITITLQVENNKNMNITNTYKLFLLVSNANLQSDSYPPELRNFENNFGISLSPVRVIYECDSLSTTKQFVIGQSGNVTNCKQGSNTPLTTETSYNVTVMLVSTYRNKSSYKLYSKSALTSGESSNTSWDLRFLVLLLLLVIALIPAIYTYRLYKKKTLATSGQDLGNRKLTSSVDSRLDVGGLNNLQSKPIPKRKFNNYVKTNLENKKLAAQHNVILENTAAKYEEIGGKTYLERIDLQFITGHRIPEVYAICDVPKHFDSFWKQVWNENIEHIVLLDSVHWHQIRKNYWPKLGLSLDIKHILVQCIHEEIFTDHEYRTFRLTYQDEIRVIDQLRFTAWTDFDLPHSLTFVNFFKKMSKMSLNRKSPILVHCSTTRAGTGFALLCDMCLRISKKDNVVDVFKNSQILKDSSFNLIDSYNCYQLAHLVILECLLSSELDVEVDLLDDKSERSVLYEKELKKYLKYMKDTAWIDQLSPDKNRDSNIYFRVDAPRYEGEVLLRPYSPDEEIDLFLSSLDGVIIDDCSCPKKYILLKHPQQDNLEHFWTMVSKVDVSVIINLNENDFFGANLLLNHGGLQVSKTLILKLVNVTHFKCYDWITVRVLIDGQKHNKDLRIFWMKNWSGEEVCPPSVQDFVEFCIESTSVTAACNSILITCCDGATASGLYVAMTYNIENIKKDKKSVICTSARLVRRYRHQFATKEEQLKFLWEATEFYMQQHNLYEIC